MDFLRVYDCITSAHDHRLAVVGVLVCLLGSLTAMHLLHHVQITTGRARAVWLGATAVATGFAIWATHFIFMLAFAPGGPTGYDAMLTVLSLIIAIILTGAAFTLATEEAGMAMARPVAGGLMGLGIAAMHYTGMAAFRVQGDISWHAGLVLASILFGMLFGTLALNIGLSNSNRHPRLKGAALLCLAICSLHFTAMGAVEITGNPSVIVPETSLSPTWLALAVAIACLTILMLGLAAIALDRRDRRRTEAELGRMQVFADIAVEGLVVCDGEKIVTANKSFLKMTGVESEALPGSPLTKFVPNHEIVERLLERERIIEGEITSFSGQLIPVEMVGRGVTYVGRSHRVIAFRDLRDRQRAEAEIRFLAHHDVLTGLPNRASFAARLQQEFSHARREGIDFAILALDLDRFKPVNDTLGHAIGDTLLKKVAQRLKATAREADQAARIGGDEFAILQCRANQPEGATALASRIIELLARPFIIEGNVVNIGVSVGISVSRTDGEDVPTLLKNADLALYRAKIEGRGTYRFFETVMDERARARRSQELELRRAIVRREFELHYQPQLNLKSGAIIGFEALLRWRHPERGLISPMDFIPLAEETGLIVSIGRWVLCTACMQAAKWPNQISVAVNLSPVQFRSNNIVDAVEAALQQSGLRAGRLELEITESALVQDCEATLAALHRLRKLGVRISMDDFGTGYSSLSYLRSFPFDRIKIDRSFVSGMTDNKECTAIVRAILGLCRSLGIATIAEGVETAAQLEYMRSEGCDDIQGYLIGKPLPPDALSTFLPDDQTVVAA